MMQRKDLAKEFSLLVQQEVKNHNDMVLASNSALDEFRRKIYEIAESTEKKITALTNFYSKDHLEIRGIEQRLQDSVAQLSSRINDVNMEMSANFQVINSSLAKRESYFLTIDGFKEFEEKIAQWMAHLKVTFAMQKDFFMDEIKKVSDSLSQYVDRMKGDIDVRFIQVKRENQEIANTLDVFAINASGITREIEICKKRCFVIEKNIENLYTRIERLKEAKP